MRERFFDNQIRQYFEKDKFAEAAAYCVALLPQLPNTHGEGHPDVAHVLANLSDAYYYLGDYPTALEAIEELVKLDCARHGEVSVEYIRHLSNLALIYRLTDRIEAAELAYDRALELMELLPLSEDWDRAITLVGRAQVHGVKREFDQAERLLQEAVRFRARSHGVCSPGLALVFDNLAGLYHQMGKSQAAERTIRKVIRMYRDTATTEGVHYASAIRLLARLLVEQSKVSEAKALADESLAILRRVRAADHPETKKAESLVNKLASQ